MIKQQAASSSQEAPKRRGRPPGAPEDRAEVVTMRVAGAGRRSKLQALGRAWLERSIDRAKLPAQ